MSRNQMVVGLDFLGAAEHGKKEYQFYRDPNGSPKGQVKMYVKEDMHVRRISFMEAPEEMQREFLKWAGKRSPSELAWPGPLWARSVMPQVA